MFLLQFKFFTENIVDNHFFSAPLSSSSYKDNSYALIFKDGLQMSNYKNPRHLLSLFPISAVQTSCSNFKSVIL